MNENPYDFFYSLKYSIKVLNKKLNLQSQNEIIRRKFRALSCISIQRLLQPDCHSWNSMHPNLDFDWNDRRHRRHPDRYQFDRM